MDKTSIPASEQSWLTDWNRGPRRTRWTSMPLQPGDAAPDLELPDSSGALHRLRTAGAGQPLVLVFLRHFGCGCTHARIERLKQELPALDAAGARTMAIGQGEPAAAHAFAGRMGLGIPLLCDPQRKSYEAFGLLEARPSQIVFGLPDPFLLRDAETGAKLQEGRRGTDRVPVDSPWQLPGEAIIDTAGIVRLIHRAAYCDDFIETKVLTSTLREIALGIPC